VIHWIFKIRWMDASIILNRWIKSNPLTIFCLLDGLYYGGWIWIWSIILLPLETNRECEWFDPRVQAPSFAVLEGSLYFRVLICHHWWNNSNVNKLCSCAYKFSPKWKCSQTGLNSSKILTSWEAVKVDYFINYQQV